MSLPRAALAAPLLLLLLPAVDAGALGTPVLTVGDHWRYEVREPVSGAVVGETTSRVAAIEYERGVAGPIDIARIESTTRVGNASSNTTVWLRGDDLAILRSETRQSRAGTALFVVQKVDYLAPCAGYRWPIAPNASWDSTCALERTTEVPGQEPRVERQTESSSTRALREEPVTVPAGTFDATVLEVARGAASPTLVHFAAAACQPVRYETESQVTALVEHHCASTAAAPRETPAPGALLVLAMALAPAVALRRGRP